MPCRGAAGLFVVVLGVLRNFRIATNPQFAEPCRNQKILPEFWAINCDKGLAIALIGGGASLYHIGKIHPHKGK